MPIGQHAYPLLCLLAIMLSRLLSLFGWFQKFLKLELFQVKCDQYWPETGTGNYGDINVTTVREDVLAFYTLRTFSVEMISSPPVKKKKGGSEISRRSVHTVYQYHYTAWPDHGVPLHALPLISFIRNSAAANAEDEPPVVVHCR